MTRTLSLVILSVITLLVNGSIRGQAPKAVEILTEYFDLLQSYNDESASYLWAEGIQERSTRFGIKYDGIAIKADCASPMMQNLESLRQTFSTPVQSSEQIAGIDLIKMSYTVRNGVLPYTYDYYAQKIGDYYWLSQPQDYYAQDWPVVESRYFRIHIQPEVENYVHRPVLDAMDKFVEDFAQKLKFDKSTLELIATKKIEYFYCQDDEMVKKITGHLTQGVLDLGTNDIISAAFPHYHELVHLLINIHLKEIPLVTLPLLREGIAVKYGGRWGKRPEALSDLAGYLYAQHFVELDSLLRYDDFVTQAQADIAYPVVGKLVSFLMDRLGYEAFFDMYRALSGSVAEVRSWDAEDVKNKLLGYTKHQDWLDLTLDFDKYLKKHLEETQVAAAGLTPKAKEILSTDQYEVYADKEWYCFRFKSTTSEPPRGNLLFGSRSEDNNQPSSLFDEQYGGALTREGYRFGVRYDQFEAGLYDYVTEELAAKYILSISPSSDYYDPEKNTITVRIRKDMIGKALFGEVDCRWLPN